MADDQISRKINKVFFEILFGAAFLFGISALVADLFAYYFWNEVFGYSTNTAYYVFVLYMLWFAFGWLLICFTADKNKEQNLLGKLHKFFIRWIWRLFFASIFIGIICILVSKVAWKEYRCYPKLVGEWSSITLKSEDRGSDTDFSHDAHNSPILIDVVTNETIFVEEQSNKTSIQQLLADSDGISVEWNSSRASHSVNVSLIQLTIKKTIFGKQVITGSSNNPFNILPLKAQTHVLATLKRNGHNTDTLRELAHDFPVAHCMSEPNASAKTCM